MWMSEDLNKKSTKYIREHACVKGQPNLTVTKFCEWVNEVLLPIVYMLPKFHCELNPIERVWAQSKHYSKAYCKYSIVSLRNTIIPALESVPLESIQKHFNKARHYMFAYLEGLPGESDLEKLVKNYKKAIKSHRRISEIQ